MFAFTDTVCVHWAVSESLAAPASALLPLCTGLDTTEPPEQDQPDRFPASKPGLVSRFAALAGTAMTTAAAPIASAAPAATRMGTLRIGPSRVKRGISREYR